jgi:DNA repair and recombination protein RAD52
MTPPPAGGNNFAPPAGEPVGFFSAKAVKQLPEEALANGTVAPKAGLAFNPKLESPSIRRTPGIDHSATKPLGRGGQHVPPRKTANYDDDDAMAGGGGGPQQQQQQQQPAPQPGSGAGVGAGRLVGGSGAPPPQQQRPANVVNPQLDGMRRIGAPVAAGNPMGNRGQFRPLTVKRPAGGGGDGLAGPGAVAAVGTGTAGVTNSHSNGRVPLSDVSSNTAGGGAGGGGGGGISGPEAKRQRVS